MQRAGAAHLSELPLQLGNTLIDQPAVDFELALAGAADEAEGAALALQVGPGAHEAAALIAQRGQLDLQLAFTAARPGAEDLEDQARAIDDLAVPGTLQIALLYRAQRRVDDDDVDLERGDRARLRLDGALPNSVDGRGRARVTASASTTSRAIASARPIASASRAAGARSRPSPLRTGWRTSARPISDVGSAFVTSCVRRRRLRGRRRLLRAVLIEQLDRHRRHDG